MSVRSSRQLRGRAAERFIQVTRRVLAAVAFTAAVGAPVSVSTAAPVVRARAITAGAIGVQLLDVPLSAYGDPRARLYIIDHLHPGTIIHRRIEISNTTVSNLHVVMYPAAAAISQGAFAAAAAHTPNELSTWTSVLPAASDIPPGEHATATVTVAVPRNAPPGEQYGVVWAETRSPAPAGGGITQVSRVGMRLYLSIGPGGVPASKFTIESLTGKRSPDGQPEVVASVHNTGGRALDMSGTLQLSAGPGGLSAGPFSAKLGTTLAIGATEPITIKLDKQIPDGPWQALVTLRSGLLERSARATINFPATGTRQLPYQLIAGFLILLLVGILAALLVRRRRNQPPPEPLGPALLRPLARQHGARGTHDALPDAVPPPPLPATR
jgi:LPXTG-motif cell wall-anchored protein